MLDMIGSVAFSIFAGICIIAGIAVLILGIRQFFGERRHCTMSTIGIVSEVVYDHDSTHRDFDNGLMPSTAYTDYGLKLIVNINGKEQEVFNGEYDSDLNRYREGDAVRIRINPDNPNEYYIDDGSMSAGVFILLVGAGLLIAGGFILKSIWF